MGKYLPKEILTGILSRLPNESLWQCKLVCKLWRDIIVYDPSFSHMHIQHRHTQNDCDSSGKVSFIFEIPTKENNVKGFYYAEFDKTNEKLLRVTDVDLTYRDEINGTIDYDTLLLHTTWAWDASSQWLTSVSPQIMKAYEEIVGSCNGLVCMTISYYTGYELFYKALSVCIPMTRECVVLPRIIGEYYDQVCERDLIDGFGYSPSTNEYKVVRIRNSEVYVYTLGDGKGWRNIGTKEYKSAIGEHIHGAYNRLDKDRNLVSFDLEDEKFGVLPSPPCFRNWDKYSSSYQLREDGEYLSIVHWNQKDGVYDVWLLKKKELDDYETNKDELDYQSWSWIKEYTLSDDSQQGKSNPFAITMDNEILFHDDRFFYRHDLNNRISYPLLGFKKNSPHYIYRAVRHVNSFVSLKALGEKDTTTMIENIVECVVLPEIIVQIDDDDDDDEPYSNDNDVGGGKGGNILKYVDDKDVEKWGGC
ncbi:F-box protein At3g07870-like [Papaver somniferum]|uniref:F-box protein At3g07870-like n=1 Tax=Papaver somniferum TaxID=3469 RepID=UPI000E6FB0CC|nr:F-box protein At3g07870-like [Papaver somniferum]